MKQSNIFKNQFCKICNDTRREAATTILEQAAVWCHEHYNNGRKLKPGYLHGWRGRGFFVRGSGFLLYLPGVSQGSWFDSDMLKPKKED